MSINVSQSVVVCVGFIITEYPIYSLIRCIEFEYRVLLCSLSFYSASNIKPRCKLEILLGKHDYMLKLDVYVI